MICTFRLMILGRLIGGGGLWGYTARFDRRDDYRMFRQQISSEVISLET